MEYLVVEEKLCIKGWYIVSLVVYNSSSVLLRSRTLGVLVVPNTPTLWIKTPPPLTQHGAKRVPRTQSSLNKRQQGYEMYLNGHLPRNGKLLKFQLILPAVEHKRKFHLVFDLLLLLFTWPLCLAYWTYCILVTLGNPVFEGAL